MFLVACASKQKGRNESKKNKHQQITVSQIWLFRGTHSYKDFGLMEYRRLPNNVDGDEYSTKQID